MKLEPFKKLGPYPSSCWIWESWLLRAGAPREQLVLAFRGTGATAQLGTPWTQAQGNSSLFSTGLILFHNLIQAMGCNMGLGLLAVHLPDTLPRPFLIKQWAQVSQFGSTKSGGEMPLAPVLSPRCSLKRAGQYSAQALAQNKRSAWSRVASNQIASGVYCWFLRVNVFLFSLKSVSPCLHGYFCITAVFPVSSWGSCLTQQISCLNSQKVHSSKTRNAAGKTAGPLRCLLQPVKREMLIRMDRGVQIQVTWIICCGECAHEEGTNTWSLVQKYIVCVSCKCL